ncbi:MAG: Flp pilus assembly protein CpaB [Vulcanimicrobiaceae bacterium]
MNVRRITIIAAIVFALGSAVLVLFFLNSFRQQNSPEALLTKVLVANQNIPARIPITAKMFTVETRPRNKVDPDVLTDPKMIHGQLALIGMPAGSLLTASKIGTPADVGLSVRLKPGQRAMSISVDPVKDVSGLIQPGDRVDVLAQGPKIGNTVQPAATILRGILVLAMGTALETVGATPSPVAQSATTVTLALTPKQADTLMTADQNAVLRLALRSPKEAIRSEPTERIVYDGVGTTASSSAPQPAQAFLPPFSSAPRTSIRGGTPTINGVTVIDGSTILQGTP